MQLKLRPMLWYLTADGRTVDVGVSREDLETPKAICPPGHRPLFPLGDGRGGLLLRKRWRGGEPKAQHVEHIGTHPFQAENNVFRT